MPTDPPTEPEHSQRARVDGVDIDVAVATSGLLVGDRLLPWLDLDAVAEGDHRVELGIADGTRLTLTHTGATHDRFLTELRAARRAERFPRLSVVEGEPVLTVESRDPTGWADVHLFANVLAVEPRSRVPNFIPLSLITGVERVEHHLTITARGMPPTTIGFLGEATDEFVARLEPSRRALAETTAAAYIAWDERLTGFPAPDGWAVTAAEAPAAFACLHDRALTGPRHESAALVSELAGAGLRCGVHLGGDASIPFLLAPVGRRIVLEVTGEDDWATFVFDLDDATTCNSLLVQIGFRRDVVALPDAELGPWAVAARTAAPVQALRAALSTRVIHDRRWAERISAALHT